jgi:hypothetical protein
MANAVGLTLAGANRVYTASRLPAPTGRKQNTAVHMESRKSFNRRDGDISLRSRVPCPLILEPSGRPAYASNIVDEREI